MKNIFDKAVANEIITRINSLKSDHSPQWGKMTVGQMLAHCNVTYEMAYEPEKHSKPNPLMKLVLKFFVKGMVVGTKPYKKNGPTAPAFVMKETKDFEVEKSKLIENIQKTQENGFEFFNGKESPSFGNLNGHEWNNLFYKHLDHHLTQFAV